MISRISGKARRVWSVLSTFLLGVLALGLLQFSYHPEYWNWLTFPSLSWENAPVLGESSVALSLSAVPNPYSGSMAVPVWRAPVVINGKNREIVIMDKEPIGTYSDEDRWIVNDPEEPPLIPRIWDSYHKFSDSWPLGVGEVVLSVGNGNAVMAQYVRMEVPDRMSWEPAPPEPISEFEVALRLRAARGEIAEAMADSGSLPLARQASLAAYLATGHFEYAATLRELELAGRDKELAAAIEARQAAQRAAEHSPYPDVELALAKRFTGDTVALIAMRDRLLAEDTFATYPFLLNIGNRLHLYAGDPEAAIPCYRRAIALITSTGRPQSGLGQLRGSLAEALLETGRRAEAREIYEEMLAISRAAGDTAMIFKDIEKFALARMDAEEGRPDRSAEIFRGIEQRRGYFNHAVFRHRNLGVDTNAKSPERTK